MGFVSVATELLSSTVAGELVKGISKLLNKEKTSKKDQEELRRKITELIYLSNNTGLAIDRYVRLLKFSTEASVQCTEMCNIMEATSKEIVNQQFKKLREVRMEINLRKEGIEKIYKYREDYEKSLESYEKAELHLRNAIKEFDAGRKSYVREMEYLTVELDKLVILAKRRIDEQTEALHETYKVFENIKL